MSVPVGRGSLAGGSDPDGGVAAAGGRILLAHGGAGRRREDQPAMPPPLPLPLLHQKNTHKKYSRLGLLLGQA